MPPLVIGLLFGAVFGLLIPTMIEVKKISTWIKYRDPRF